MRVLLVEDTLDVASAIVASFAKRGHALDHAATAAAARDFLSVQAYDLVILDINLPDGEGTDVLRWLRRQRRPTPVLMLTAPAPASEKALRLAGMNVNDIDLWEINEAFAAVVLQTERALGLDPERVNVNGGAIALGHPLGATGAMLIGAALDELERSNKTTALVTLCIGGGQGIATILERI